MYQVLYRKYRPKVFADVYGQNHVTSTLKNEIKEGRVSHAYLFTGSRGTGKTSCAKILAKAVNCENSVDGEPCNECEMCKGLDSGSIYDVVEIDAASNNGVDNIRDLREEVNYTPTRGKYRVYIIDEVHMLSAGAFNALLKTLEEPPAHVIFILATTEVHKLPATILSRCQRFDFKRIQPETMSIRLKEVASLEGMMLDDDAAILIARIADGALRDGLSILDQCAGRSSNITSSLVSEVAGLAGREALFDLSSAISNGDSAQAMNIISNLHENSYDMERLAVEMISHLRNYLITKTVKDSCSLIVCTDDEYQKIVDGASKLTLEKVIFSLDLFQETLAKIKSGATARVEMEMSFIRLCQPKLDTSYDALNDRISSLEMAIKSGTYVNDNSFTSNEIKPKAEAALHQEDDEISKLKPKTEHNVANVENYANADDSKEDDFAEDFIPELPFDGGKMLSKNVNTSQNSDLNTATVENKTSVIEDKPQIDNDTPPEKREESDNQYEFDKWPDFLDMIHHGDIAIFGLLSGARGYVRGDHFLIDSTNPAIKDFISLPTHSRAIRKALFDLTGVKYKLGIFKRADDNANKQKRDPLEDLIGMAKADNVEVIEK